MITKTHAAEKQLDTAIRLFFENIDHLSSYTLAAASREITDDLCEKKKDEIFRTELARVGDPLKVYLSFRDEFRFHIKEEYYKDALRLSRRTQNFLKHADTDSDDETDDISVKELALVILFAVKNFVLLEQRWTPTMSMFFSWFAAANPKYIKDGVATNEQWKKVVLGLRETFFDLYSPQSFHAIYESITKVKPV
jgi:hypothetical protein